MKIYAGLANLRDILLVGNPLYNDFPADQCRIEVIKRLPQVQKIDGEMVKPSERDTAMGTVSS
jgi:dynein light chain 1